MSYLQCPRIVFSGDFQADVSTVNNDVRHYDNANFLPSFQEYGTRGANGWWNPSGGAAFRFVNCTVRSGERLDGTVVNDAADDSVIGKLVAGPSDRSSGKMVDLDPQMQMTSQLIAVGIRLYTPENKLLLQGTLADTGFRDLSLRQLSGGNVNGQPLGALWTSSLNDLEWGDIQGSALLPELKASAVDGRLSVNLAGFGYYYNHANDGRFSMGRLLGSIGPWKMGEPERFAPARRLYSAFAPNGNTLFGYSNFAVSDDDRLTLDLGNSIPIKDALGTIDDSFSTFKVVVSKSKMTDRGNTSTPVFADPANYEPIGEIRLTNRNDWLLNTGGMVSLSIPSAAKSLIENHQVLLVWLRNNREIVVAQESENGIMAKADQNVQRINAGQTKHVDFYAYQWGKPLANTSFNLLQVNVEKEDPADPGDPFFPNTPTPATGVPASALSYPKTIKTDSLGKYTIDVLGKDLNSPRGYIDGQMYNIGFELTNSNGRLAGYSRDWIFILLFDEYKVPDAPTWNDVGPIWRQFGNLYPIMSKHIVNMGDRDAILERKDLLVYAFSLKEDDPMYMPVTRDLSENKRAALVKWLRNPSVDDALPEEEMEGIRSAPRVAQPVSEAVTPMGIEEVEVLKQETLSKGGVMDILPIPEFSPADLKFED